MLHSLCAAGGRARVEQCAAIRIESPMDGSIHAYDPGIGPVFQRIEMRAKLPARAGHIRWMVDGEVLDTGTGPAPRYWNVKRGKHRFRIKAFVSGRMVTDESRIVVK